MTCRHDNTSRLHTGPPDFEMVPDVVFCLDCHRASDEPDFTPTEGATMTNTDEFLREHCPSFAYTRGGEYVAVCAGCTRSAGDYVEWPCADVWGVVDSFVHKADLLAEAERRGAERGGLAQQVASDLANAIAQKADDLRLFEDPQETPTCLLPRVFKALWDDGYAAGFHDVGYGDTSYRTGADQ